MSLKSIVQTTSKLTIGSIFSALIILVVILLLLVDHEFPESVTKNLAVFSTTGSLLIGAVAIWITLKNERKEYLASKAIFKHSLLDVSGEIREKIKNVSRNARSAEHQLNIYEQFINYIVTAEDKYIPLMRENLKIKLSDEYKEEPEKYNEQIIEENRLKARIDDLEARLGFFLFTYRGLASSMQFYVDLQLEQQVKELKKESVYLKEDKDLRCRLYRLIDCIKYISVVFGDEHSVAELSRRVKEDLSDSSARRVDLDNHKALYDEVNKAIAHIENELNQVEKDI